MEAMSLSFRRVGSWRPRGPRQVVLHLLHGTDVRAVRVQVHVAQRPALPEQVPALVELFLDLAQGRAVLDTVVLRRVGELSAQRVLVLDERRHLSQQRLLRVVGHRSLLCCSTRRVSWTREFTPTLVNTDRRWVEIVLTETNSSAAAERLVWPSAINRATLTSVSVSASQPNLGRSPRSAAPAGGSPPGSTYSQVTAESRRIPGRCCSIHAASSSSPVDSTTTSRIGRWQACRRSSPSSSSSSAGSLSVCPCRLRRDVWIATWSSASSAAQRSPA